MIPRALLAVLALLSAVAPAAAAGRPAVLTRFDISVIEVNDGLGSEADDVEQWFSCELAARLGEHFGYLDWVPAGAAAGTEVVVGRLDLVLVSRKVTPRLIVYDVLFRAVADGRRVALPLDIFGRTLFGGTDPKPVRPPYVGELRRRLQALVRPSAEGELFINDRLLSELEVRFLEKVPIARELEPLVSDQALVLPLTAGQLRAANGTPLKAELQVLRPDWSAAKDGSLELYKRGVCRVPGLEDRVETSVSRFELGTIKTNEWHPEIAAAVRDYRVPKSLRVFMLDYRADPYASGGEEEGVASLAPEPWELLQCQQ